MKIFGLRKVLHSLIFGCISSIVLLFIELEDIAQYIKYDINRFFTGLLLQAVLLSIAFLYVSVVIQLIKGNHEDENHLKALERFRLALQVLLVMLTASVFFIPILNNFFFVFSILLGCVGAILYFKSKSRLSVSLIIWGLVILLLNYLMVILVYGIENCIV